MGADSKPVIIGMGPAGLFAALELIERGMKPVIFERGKKIEDRNKDVLSFQTDRILNTESNIQFGEGGAGTYSDGKLFSRPGKNTVYAKKVLDTFVKFGAPKEITEEPKPHLGTEIIRRIVVEMRDHIINNGGEVHFSSRLTNIRCINGKISEIEINSAQRHAADNVFLATGNGARDIFKLLDDAGIALESKPITVGLRIEHPAAIIKKMRNGVVTYSLNYTNKKNGRGAYTFCMCPGGEIVNSSTENGGLVLNGMSFSARAGYYSNAAIVVNCEVRDYGSAHPLAGVEFQKQVEQEAFLAGGSSWKAPAQTLSSFIDNCMDSALPDSSYKMGSTPANLRNILPPFISDTILEAFTHWKKETPDFIYHDALLHGVETRTSSPVRIVRNSKFSSISADNLYPLGEGSGYSGGITSAAIDAIRAVEVFCHE